MLIPHWLPSFESKSSLNNPKWEIEKLEVGIGATGSLGIGLWKVGATPGFRLMFRPKK